MASRAISCAQCAHSIPYEGSRAALTPPLRHAPLLPQMGAMIITRFAPSPTGLLHLGHSWSALVAHDLARSSGGTFHLRVDDIDAGRSRQDRRDAIDTDLAWLGLIPDGHAWVQSDHLDSYAQALERLKQMGLVYPCYCTRAEISAEVAASAQAPHGANGICYPGTCRPTASMPRRAGVDRDRPHAWRLNMAAAVAAAGSLSWQDENDTARVARPHLHGDVVLARRDAASAYHLASTIDDAAMGITHVVRGADLLAATDIHRLLQALLDLPTPVYHHHRLVGTSAGRRLAKRDDAASLAAMRDSGVDPAALVAAMRDGRLPEGYCWVGRGA